MPVTGEVLPVVQSREDNDAVHRAHRFGFSGGARIVILELGGTRYGALTSANDLATAQKRRHKSRLVICATNATGGFMGLFSI